ncbi:solute carrier family 25 member 35 [Syngnathoides biaculeatus]|uniref:solute carrier family 25 member 35 n=1 Tax=Syngnathoides biaculeatus TaxID=300417 RepID=UPI002ADE5D2F|nr:solute carrier family 25 member 35 [Syngnathoides biaculeatus]
MDFLLSGAAACGACLLTNPLEVVKTRMQLQGELQSRGSYQVYYRNVFHAFYTIAKVDGVAGLQKGLVPGLWYQFCMNGVRLGSYAVIESSGHIHTAEGRVSGAKAVAAGATSGVVGAVMGSPVYLVKTHLQSQSTASIAVGHQYKHQGMSHALAAIYKEHGIQGLWRGAGAAIPRVSVGSASQLATFSSAKELVLDLQVFAKDSWLVALSAGMISSVAVALAMTPFDVASTRLYNQPVDQRGQGLLYKGFADCFSKTLKKEGVVGLYKGAAAGALHPLDWGEKGCGTLGKNARGRAGRPAELVPPSPSDVLIDRVCGGGSLSVAALALKNGPLCKVVSIWATPFKDSDPHYLSDDRWWGKRTEPENVVRFNVGLFGTLLACGCLQALLCAVQMINGLVGCLCGTCGGKGVVGAPPGQVGVLRRNPKFTIIFIEEPEFHVRLTLTIGTRDPRTSHPRRYISLRYKVHQ